MIENTPVKIAIINTTHIGTMLMNIPLIIRIKNQYPDAEITIILVKRNAVLQNILNGLGLQCHCMPNFDGKQKYLYILSAWKKFWKSFDLCICGLEPRKIDHLLMWGIARKTIAYVEDNWHGKLITYPSKFNKKSMQQMHQSQFISNVFNIKKIESKEWPKINLNDYPLQEELPYLEKNYHYIFISPSNNRLSCSLTPKDYFQILQPICNEFNLRIIINCLQEDMKIAREIQELLDPFANIITTPNFSSLLHLMNSCNIFFLGDGGLAHLAAALEKPSLVLFGETSVTVWSPLNTKCIMLFNEKDIKLINHELIRTKLRVLISEKL